MRPQARLTIDGAAASGALMDRVISIDVTDKEGSTSDTCSIELNNYPAAAIPRTGAKIRIWLGYGGQDLSFMGTFVVDTVEIGLFPHTMSITGKSADFRETMKENKERHWDNKSVAEIVSEIAGDHGLAAKVDAEVGAYVYTWLGQQDESDIHILRRLERRHGALFSVKDGNVVFARRGSGTNAGGAALTEVVVTKKNIIEGTGKIRFSDRAEYKEVVAYAHDTETGERRELKWQSSPEADAIYRIGEPFADDGEAEAAAKSKSKDLKRQQKDFSCTIIGTPSARAGAPLSFSGMEAGIDGIEFIIETAKHDWSKSGYQTSLDGKLKV